MPGEKGRHGSEIDEGTETVRDDEADAAADDHDENCFEEKLAKDGLARGAECHADADFPRAFADADEHDVMTLRPPRKSVATPTQPMKISMPTIIMRLACAFFTVSQMLAASSSRGSKPLQTGQCTAKLTNAVFVRFEIPAARRGGGQRSVRCRRLIWGIAAHGVERNKYLARVEAIVAGVLSLGFIVPMTV